MDRTRRVVVTATYIAIISALFAALAFFASHVLVSRALHALAVNTAEPPMYLGSLQSAPPRSASLFVAGDVMLDRTVATRIAQSRNDAYPFAKVQTDPRFTLPDIRLVNLEGPVTSKRAPPEKEIDFQFDPKFAGVLKRIGIDVVSQANNHSLDQGRAGADESHRLLSAAGLLVFGDEVRDDSIALAVTEVRGQRIAFVGFNETSSDLDDQAADTLKTAHESAGTVIVFMHWGEEYKNQPTTRQENRARWLIDHGADIVIGSHPHWVEGISIYNGHPIIYSLGNFVFDQDWSEETRQGLALGLTLKDGGVTVNLYPLHIDLSQPRFVEDAERTARLRDLASVSDAALMPQILQGEVTFPNIAHAPPPSL